MVITVDKPFVRLLAFLMATVLTGCGLTQTMKDGAVSVTRSIFYPWVEILRLDLCAREGMSNNAKGASSVMMVCVYQLEDRQASDNTDYPPLFADDGQALQTDRTAEKDVHLCSDGPVTVDIPIEINAQFMTMVTVFVNPDLTQSSWRLVLIRDNLDSARPRIIEASQNQLTLHPLKER